MKAIIVGNAATSTVHIYDVPKKYESEQIEDFIESQGHRMSESCWMEFDGEIDDCRNESYSLFEEIAKITNPNN